MSDKQRYLELLRSTKRRGIEDLITHMEQNGFFRAPCSSRYHLATEGGLLKHSLNVYDTAKSIQNVAKNPVTNNELIIACLLHDLGKMGQFGKPYYIEKKLKSGKTAAEPYQTNPELKKVPHEATSIFIASRFINLTEEEQYAIYYHNGKYTKAGLEMAEETPLQMILHFSDMWCSRVIED